MHFTLATVALLAASTNAFAPSVCDPLLSLPLESILPA
jgi:hypothetical protein